MSAHSIVVALLLTLAAGASTGIGSLMAFIPGATSRRFLSGALGLSAGVMLYVSFVDLFPQALESMASVAPGKTGIWWVTLAFFCGMGLIALIDWLVPEDENPHEFQHFESEQLAKADKSTDEKNHLRRTGVMLALAIGIHNFPEGMATFISALDGLEVAVPIVAAIAIHNIPEGIAVAVPIYNATGNRRKALLYSFLSGLAEPVGALIGLLFLLPLWTPTVSALLYAGVAGVMVYISIDELLPGAEKYGYHHISMAGVCLGMAIMAVSIILL